VLLTAGMHDPRVPAWQPAKLTARLQAATTSGRPVVLRVEAHGGHRFGSTRDQESALLADELAFLLHAFGLDDPDRRGSPSGSFPVHIEGNVRASAKRRGGGASGPEHGRTSGDMQCTSSPNSVTRCCAHQRSVATTQSRAFCMGG
jgi:hypothetical protein